MSSSNLNMDRIISSINKEKKTVKKSVLKHKISLRRAQTDDDEVIVGDMMPRIDVSKLKSKDKEKLERMRRRKDKKELLLYPEDQEKVTWDLFITVVLLASCMITPYRIAFQDYNTAEPLAWTIVSFTIDFFFFIDIIIIFNSAFYDEEFLIVEDRKLIAKDYIFSWFMVDLMAIIPFDYLLVQDNYQEIIRFTRIGRISRLIKMTRLLRILKIVKQRSQLLKYLNEILKIGLGFERLIFFLLILIILCHILTCIWVITASFKDEGGDSWINPYEEKHDGEIYIISLYAIITTMTTVGYGDITGADTLEFAVSIIIMIIGVVSFSFGTGSLSSILSNYDQANAKL